MSNIDCYPFDPLIGPPPPIGGGIVSTPSTSVETYTMCDGITGTPVEVRYTDDGAGTITGPTYHDPSSGAVIVPNLPLIDCLGPVATCQQGCDYAPLTTAASGAGNLPIQFVGYQNPGDSRFELRIDFVNSPAVFAQLQAWITAPGGIQQGDFWFMDTQWINTTTGIPSASTGAGLLIGEWMLANTQPDIVGTQIRFLLDLNYASPCDLAQFAGFVFDVADISNAWLYAQAFEVRNNPNWILGSINANAIGASFLSRAVSNPISVVRICDGTPVRVDQVPVSVQYDIQDISGRTLNLDTLDATSVTITVIAGGVVTMGRGPAGSPHQVVVPPGQYSFDIDAARGILINASDNVIAATERGFTVDATLGAALVHWTWQASP